jgi:NAD(P)-dependent dehydrogenase (short-subunit alcohol dehydrogenase family)
MGSLAGADVEFDFSGRTVVITGGTTGIGMALADGFRDAGADTVITGTRERSQYTEDFGSHRFLQFDLGSAESAVQVASRLERCDVLINNAGGMLRNPSEMEPDGFAVSVDINLNGIFRLCHALYPLLKVRGGAIVNTSSMAATFASPRVPAYSAAKAGVVALTKSLANAWAADDIRVNAIAPGWIETRMTAAHVANPDRSDPIMSRTALGRWGSSSDMVGPTMFLASDASRYITGALLDVDGGYHAG